MAKRGRPSFQPTAKDRKKVKELLGEGTPLSDVAKLFGISVPTVRKCFQAEILSERKSAPAKTPARKVTDAMREKVKRYVGCKMPLQDVAYALGYETDAEFEAFQADFVREIRIGAAQYRAKVIDRLDEQMTAGTMGATNRLETITQPIGDTEPGDRAAQPQGKKAAAKAGAEATVSGGGKFAPRAAPRLAAVNGRPIDKAD